MTRRVSFEVLSLVGICLLIWIGVRVWHMVPSFTLWPNHLEVILPFFVLLVWFSCRRVQRDLDQIASHVDGSTVDRLSRNSMAIGYLCYSLIFILLVRY